MAISGATKADALAAARKYGMSESEMRTTLNVSSVAATVTASETAANTVTVAWTNLDGPKMVDVGDGVLHGPVNSSESDLVVADVDNAVDLIATVYATGAKKSSSAYTVDGS